MRCPACATDNPADSPNCGKCGEKLAKPSRRRVPNFDDKYSLIGSRVPKNRKAVLAYRCAMFGLIPGLGLLLGGVAVGMGFFGYRHALAAPSDRGLGHAVAAMILGSLELVSHVVGFTLIWIGLHAVT
jgi:hypothetical protein